MQLSHSVSEKAEYKIRNDVEHSIAFCDVEQMHNSKPTAPVYVNNEPTGARWLSLDKDRLVSKNVSVLLTQTRGHKLNKIGS